MSEALFGDSHRVHTIPHKSGQPIGIRENLPQRCIVPTLDHGPEDHVSSQGVNDCRLGNANSRGIGNWANCNFSSS